MYDKMPSSLPDHKMEYIVYKFAAKPFHQNPDKKKILLYFCN